jgi:phosphoserine phosphatase
MGTKGRDVVESVARIIPGYKGYSEREKRRDMDKLVRETMAKTIDAARHDLDAVLADLGRRGAFEHLETIEAIRRRAGTEAERLRRAPAGFSGFFDTIQVEAEQLDRIHEHDSRLGEQAQAFQSAVDALKGELDAEHLKATAQAIERIEDHVRRRENVMKGVE